MDGRLEVRRRHREYVVVFEFNAEECRAIAATLSSRDTWGEELLRAADELDEINGVYGND
jgi:hypothetical protein